MGLCVCAVWSKREFLVKVRAINTHIHSVCCTLKRMEKFSLKWCPVGLNEKVLAPVRELIEWPARSQRVLIMTSFLHGPLSSSRRPPCSRTRTCARDDRAISSISSALFSRRPHRRSPTRPRQCTGIEFNSRAHALSDGRRQTAAKWPKAITERARQP